MYSLIIFYIVVCVNIYGPAYVDYILAVVDPGGGGFKKLQKSSKHCFISIFFHLERRGHPFPVPPPLAISGLEQWVPMFCNFLVTNVFCQYLYTILPYKMQILECCRSHLSIFLFPFSFHLGRGRQPLPVPPTRYNFVVKNVFCQYLYTI